MEGWKPTEFKSSRSEKALSKQSRPEDFMDDEDIGEHGIAPQTVKATNDYASNRKRKKQVLVQSHNCVFCTFFSEIAANIYRV